MKQYHDIRNTKKFLAHGVNNGMGPFKNGKKKAPRLVATAGAQGANIQAQDTTEPATCKGEAEFYRQIIAEMIQGMQSVKALRAIYGLAQCYMKKGDMQ